MKVIGSGIGWDGSRPGGAGDVRQCSANVMSELRAATGRGADTVGLRQTADERQPEPYARAVRARPHPSTVVADRDLKLFRAPVQEQRERALGSPHVAVDDDVADGLGDREPDRVENLVAGSRALGGVRRDTARAAHGLRSRRPVVLGSNHCYSDYPSRAAANVEFRRRGALRRF